MTSVSAFASVKNMNSNLNIVSNLWIDPEKPESTTAWTCQPQIPGDFMVNLIGDRDVRILAYTLTPKQMREYKERRFFYSHGEHGTAFLSS